MDSTPALRRLPRAIPVAIGLAWVAALVSHAAGRAELGHHDFVIESGLPPWAALGLFLISWQVMIAAMMLPSSLPMVRLFSTVSRRQDGNRIALTLFLAGYVLVWTAFGFLAFLADVALHRIVGMSPWLGAHPQLISSAVLIGAGAFQFTKLKDRCLEECRHPGVFLMRRYRRGPREGFRLGRDHGLFCLGCCWALMVVMFSVGVTDLTWMALLGAVMMYEKIGRHGKSLTPAVGVALLGIGGLMLAFPPVVLLH